MIKLLQVQPLGFNFFFFEGGCLVSVHDLLSIETSVDGKTLCRNEGNILMIFLGQYGLQNIGMTAIHM